ncbi:MAG: hypothetical protein V1833_02480 [Elusimicrobiota bacterium]
MKLTKKQKENLAKVFFNLSQIVFASLIIGKIATPDKFSLFTFIVGVILFLAFLIIGVILDTGDGI